MFNFLYSETGAKISRGDVVFSLVYYKLQLHGCIARPFSPYFPPLKMNPIIFPLDIAADELLPT